ncbi:conjugal transfer protein MobC [Belliella kenyensis]|uniref:Conjugal transfer protein MobC n=1 Tax=Belliella kenyensis TaxID=1472724 RepID=A0ABV8ESP1_9BACT|nr:conjugal transfer protein MobC [Belliella kenyensis]MCH7402260.1 YWFCY domain-containing protein [Belliella kenyensis]MDN3601776.1 conjugal transfer protein MobC [Belliella kenyensis]
MATGENQEALRKILDLTRKIGFGILLFHFYWECKTAVKNWKLDINLVDQFVNELAKTGLFSEFWLPKALAMLLLLISILGVKGKKSLAIGLLPVLVMGSFGLACYWLSGLLFYSIGELLRLEYLYISLTFFGYLLLLSSGIRFSRIVWNKDQTDIFNKLNETFPQEERKLENEYAVNLPAIYRIGNKVRKSWINFINPFRAILVVGTPGSGKSYFVIRHIITQHIAKGFSMFIYDFKYDDLSKIAYNALLNNASAYQTVPKFYTINFDNLEHSHRCNPLEPSTMLDITDASESSRTIMMGLNREWIKKQGDFFVESPINFLTAVIWFLKKYRKGKYCTLPHVIELMQVEYDKLFSVLRTEPEIEVLINPFVSAYLQGAAEQLEGQIASAKITMARLASPQLYYVLSSSEFTLDINNPDEPKIVCMGNNPQKQQVYGAVLSLYISRITKIVNRKNQLKSSLVFDEFPTIYFNGIDSLIATARGNKVATTLGVQDYSQLKKDYGREQAEVIMNTVGNIISGQVLGETAKQLSDRFGKIMQARQSHSINSNDTSVSHSRQMDLAVPPSTISTLSSGEFVGIVADNPDQEITLKRFHAKIINDHEGIANEEKQYQDIKKVRDLAVSEVMENYQSVKSEISQLIDMELERMMDSPGLAGLIIRARS